MNSKNIYFNNPPNFVELSKLYPEFGKFVFKNKYNTYSINWKCKYAQKELCRTLLHHDFGVEFWDIPDGFLIPSLTSRCNYIHWIDDILGGHEGTNIKGLDIGTGANCIYPLVGNKTYKWKFLATDINPDALLIANKIISKNNLNDSIQLLEQFNSDCIFKNIIHERDYFHFSMCNPPYFSYDEIKRNNPYKVCEYNEKEVYCYGGELRFIIKMINESEEYKYQISWFTTLVGKKINFDKILIILKSIKGITEIKTTAFCQGKLTRWGIAWSYLDKEKLNKFEIFDNDLHIKSKSRLICKMRFTGKKRKRDLKIKEI